MNINIRKQAGLSIIELLIASTLSLILLTGVIQIFVSTKQAYSTTDNVSRAQENGRFAIDVLSKYARMGGYWDYGINDDTPAPFATRCAAVADLPCTQDGVENNNSDRLAVQFASPDNIDCNGNAPSANRVFMNVFWIQVDGFGVSSLYCQGYDSTTANWMGDAQPYISGIDSLQILYGIQDATGSVTHYVNASRMDNGVDDNGDGDLADPNEFDWFNVRAVKIAILAQSGLAEDANYGDRTYVLLDSEPLRFTDGQARYIFSTTLFISNTEA
mgnify:CR=1 FL=1